MRPWTLTAKLTATGVTFLVLALASIGLTLWVSWKLEGGAAAVNEAGRLRMTTWQMAQGLAPEGAQPHAATRRLAARFESSLDLLGTGDPSRPLSVPWAEGTRASYEAVRRDWRALSDAWLGQQPRGDVAARAEAFVAEVDALVAAIEAELAHWTTILRLFQLAMMGLAIASAVALMVVGYLMVLDPLGRLRRGIAALQEGALGTRVPVDRGDEFGQLAEGFNAMAQALQTAYATLEERVRDKTARLEVKRQRLADLYEVSRFLADATSLDALARGFAAHIRRVARADAAAVRWSDEANNRYMLLAAENLPASMHEDERCLDTGSCHCGQQAGAAATRVIPIVAADAPMQHCGRAGFRTLVSVPVRLHEQMLGEVDLFFRTPVELPAEERELLDTLASHLAGAMESLRAQALEREAAVAEERGLLARELHDSIAQSLAFLKIQVQLLRESVRTDNRPAMDRAIGELDAGVRESLADVRELLLHFRIRTNGEAIEPALATTLSKFRHQTGLDAELDVQGHGLPLAPDVQVQVLHIVQEALSNVRKHARAARVQVRVRSAPGWRFEVQDDGIGFAAGDRDPGGPSVGLRIMQERAERIGATVTIDSHPGQGTCMRLDLPHAGPAAPEPAAALP